MLLASHNMAEVERLCDEVIMLRRGEIVDHGSPAVLLAKYGRSTLDDVFLDISGRCQHECGRIGTRQWTAAYWRHDGAAFLPDPTVMAAPASLPCYPVMQLLVWAFVTKYSPRKVAVRAYCRQRRAFC